MTLSSLSPRAQGAFLVSSEIENGVVKYVLVKSLAGDTCRIVNPWPGRDYVFYPVQVRDLENQKTVDSKIKGYQIEFENEPGHTYVVERPENR